MALQTQAAEGAGGARSDLPEITGFARNVIAMLERTEYRRCQTGEDFESIYRLRYDAYRLNDLVPANPQGMVYDEYDTLPNCRIFGVYIDGDLVSTIRLHHVTSTTPRSPVMSVYGDVLQPRLDAGDTFIDPSRFAVDVEASRIYPQIPYLTLRLAVMACIHFEAPYCMSMIREDHAAFYKRIYKARAIGEARPYAGVINCYALLYQADVLAIREETFARFPFFKSTRLERRLLFGTPESGELPALTILPTAKYYSDAA
jgi:hypothetical protein